jgi:hypothetical protein
MESNPPVTNEGGVPRGGLTGTERLPDLVHERHLREFAVPIVAGVETPREAHKPPPADEVARTNSHVVRVPTRKDRLMDLLWSLQPNPQLERKLSGRRK